MSGGSPFERSLPQSNKTVITHLNLVGSAFYASLNPTNTATVPRGVNSILILNSFNLKFKMERGNHSS